MEQTTSQSPAQTPLFDRYQVFLIGLLAIVQFTNALDFMIMSPLGALLLRVLDITTAQFGVVVSAYAFSAAFFGIAGAMVADRYDRKKLLVTVYGGFIIGTVFCAVAPTYETLLAARIVAGAFGGLLYSSVLTIIGDAFPIQVRGRVMGIIMLAFSLTQVVGIPLGLYLATTFEWHAPFWLVSALSAVVLVVMIRWMRPMSDHVDGAAREPLRVLLRIVGQPGHARAFFASALLAAQGFLLMPFVTPFLVGNVGLAEQQLPLVYLIAGACTVVVMPFIGRISDQLGKFPVLVAASILAGATVILYTNLSHTELWIVIAVYTVLVISASMRMVPAMALMTAVPDNRDRAGFMNLSSSIQQIGGGVASIVGGIVTYRNAAGELVNYDDLGYVSAALMACVVVMMYGINKHVYRNAHSTA